MNNSAGESRCILVPIDLHGVNRGTLELLVHIARQLDRSLLGLLLEDTRLQRVAELPFTTEISLDSGRERSLLRDHLSQRHSKVTADTQRTLSELAEKDKIQLRYEDAAGARWHTALERDGQLDIFFPARRRWQIATRGHGKRDSSPLRLGLLLAHTDQDQRVLEAAGLILRAGLGGDVYVLSDRTPPPGQLRALYLPHTRVGIQSNLSCHPATVTSLIRQSPYDLLLLPRDCLQGISPESLDTALDKSGAQVLIIN